ncbi:MAG: tRNA (adenosine(37)-N6)-dimethylallyltransferase MiaA [Kofleriaceae bacterium]
MTTAAPRLVVVVGPTGAGKSDLAIALAAAVDGCVVSCDSQQVYRGMDVGTGKVSAAARARVPHHLLDLLAPDEEMTAARFVAEADAAIAGAGRPVVVCGGTGLYVRALLRGLFAGPGADPAIRARLEADADRDGTAALHARLAAIDPDHAARVLPGDRRRIVRALEVYELTGEPMSAHHARHDHRRVPPRYAARIVGVAPPRPELDARIEARVDEMMAAGLLDEVRALRAAGFRPPLRSQQAIGYGELHAYLDGASSLDEAVALIKRNSRRYARRQLSWYRGDPEVTWAAAAGDVDLADLGRYLTSLPPGAP